MGQPGSNRLLVTTAITVISIFVLLVTLKSWSTTALKPNDFKLELVQVIFRHGDRTPEGIEIYPSLPYNKSIYEPFGIGQLTNVGKRREYEIGQVLRNRYRNFLSSIYKPSEVYAYSTNYDRTKMSLQLVLAGLYPPDDLLKWNKQIDWIPFVTFYNRKELDFLQTSSTCSIYQKLLREALTSPEVLEKFSKYNDTITRVLKCAGFPAVNDIVLIFPTFNLIQSHRSMGLPLPEWLSKQQYSDIKKVIGMMYEVMSLTTTMKKIASGATLKRFIDNINKQEKKMNERKIYLYSAHDLNVMSFIKSHELKYPKIAMFGTAVIMEKLRGSDSKIYIRLLVWTGEDKELVTLKLDRCNELCSLSEYLKIIEPVLPEGKGTECSLKNLNVTFLADIANAESN